jgi:gliding motility-associated-like protein
LKRRLLIVCILFICTCTSVLAQTGYSNLEFVENKGQWDKKISFKTQINNGSFFLQKHGFTVLLHNADDMERLRTIAHGQIPDSKSNQIATKSPGSAKTVLNKNEKNIVHSHAYEVSFVNANENPEIVPDKPLPTYNNYFIGSDPSKWASNCQVYQAITYKNIYPNIDLRYYTENGTLKYDIIVHPGADPDMIAMKYIGADKLSIKQNQLITHTSVMDVKEFVPHSFEITKTNRSELECKYVIEGNNIVRFKLGKYDKDATLIIDPTWIFTTFTGSKSDNWGYTATYDDNGNFYSGSIVLNDRDGGNGFLVSPGAYQSTFQGGDGSEGGEFGYDVGIMKFNSTGSTRLYATYLGGAGDEQPHSLVVDNAGNLVVAGRTSSSDFPTKVSSGGSGNYGAGGGFDIFLAKFNANGTNLIGSRKIGGAGWDGVNIAPKYYIGTGLPMGQLSLRLNYGDDGRSEVIVDAANNVYLASSTQSDNFPCTPNAFQTSRNGKQDGVFIKTNPDLSVILASTYLGGSNDDAAFVLALNPITGDVYIGGGTSSIDFPGRNNAPVLFNALNVSGGSPTIDGFVSIISNDGGTLKRTSYFGTPGTEVIYGVQFDKKGFPYIMGTTTGAWPVLPASVWSQPKGKQFIAKLQPDLNGWIYSTVFGKGDVYPDISPTAFLVDRCENVYVAGWGGGIETERDGSYNNATTSGLYTTPDAIKKNTDGSDFYFIVLKKNASGPLYATFFGQDGGRVGDHVDGGTSRFDKQGVIYEAICANCGGGATFPTTPGAWAATNGALYEGGCNLAALKIAFNFAGVAADIKAYINNVIDTAGCTNVNITFKDTIANAQFYIWNFDTANHPKSDTTTTATIAHKYPTKGIYTIRLIAVDSNTCNVADTVYTTVKIGDVHAFLTPSAAVIGDCRDLNYQLLNLTTITPNHPNPPFTNSSFKWDFGDGTTLVYNGNNPPPHHYPAPGSYNASLTLIDTSYCNSPETVSLLLNVAQFTTAHFTTSTNACIGIPTIFSNTSTSAQQFIWDFGDNTSSTEANPAHTYTDIGTYTVKLIAIDSTTCNRVDSTQLTVSVNSRPTAAFNDQPIPPEFNKPTIFFNNSTGATHFKWIFGDGDELLKSSMDTVVHQYRKTGTFQACLIAFNQFECSDTACLPVETLINPLLDVPNAFTPGRFGQNSIIKVQGFGISSLIFRIYNRWGRMVFESNDQNLGWDGTYKGTPQPMDVYAYTLDATFFDGTKTTRKGDITLIR